MLTIEQLHAQWLALGEDRAKDRAVAQALGGELAPDDRVRFGDREEALPRVTANLEEAQRAMDRSWLMMEESAPLRLVCHVAPRARGGSGRECHVEWWPEDGSHVVTPTFHRESEARAFAAFVFARWTAAAE